MASIQARHHPRCAIGDGKWRFKKIGTPGCTCPRGTGPVYYTHHRDPITDKTRYTIVGKDRETAQRARRDLENQLDEARRLARLGARPRERQDTTFAEWADAWHTGLTCKENTKRSYVATLDYGKAA